MLDITLGINTKLLELFKMLDVIPNQFVWIFLVVIIVFIASTIHAITNFSLKKLDKKFALSSRYWTYALITSIKSPIRFLIWFIGALWIIQVIAAHSDNNFNKHIAISFELGIVIILGWFFIRLISEAEKAYLALKKRKNESTDISTIKAVNKILNAIIILTTGVITLHTLGISVSGVLAIGGVGGIAVGFAAQDLLANFFGALMIYVDKPFKIGDWIRSPDREIEGTVEEIGWRMTKIKTFNQRPLYVPNRVFTGIAVENASRMEKRQIKETIGIRYQDLPKMEKIVAEIKQELLENPDIDKGRSLVVAFNGYGGSSVDILVYCFSHATTLDDYSLVKQKVLLDIKNVVENNAADFAFPTSVVYLENS